MPQTLESLIEKEYETVQKAREDLLAKRAEIDDQLRALDRRLDAAANYKATLEGKFARPARTGQRKPRAPSTGRAPRGAGGELQKRILSVIPNTLMARPPRSSTPNSKPPPLTQRSPSPPLCSG